jgi:hypothetical protein
MLNIEIRIKGQIINSGLGWLNHLTLSHSDPDETILTGIVSDQFVLYQLITHLRDLGLYLISISSEDLMDQNPP